MQCCYGPEREAQPEQDMGLGDSDSDVISDDEISQASDAEDEEEIVQQRYRTRLLAQQLVSSRGLVHDGRVPHLDPDPGQPLRQYQSPQTALGCQRQGPGPIRIKKTRRHFRRSGEHWKPGYCHAVDKRVCCF